MEQALNTPLETAAQDRKIFETVQSETTRLRNFIRSRVADEGLVEDILQDTFFELVEAHRLMKPVEQAGAWLFQVARNRITDWFRKKKPDLSIQDSDSEHGLTLEDLLPSPHAGPEAQYALRILGAELEAALEELPAGQRQVFVANEIEGRSFRELAAESGVSINTLLARKRYAVKHLRKRLQSIHEQFLNE